MTSLAEKVAFVTGASSGIGRAAALKLAQEGAKIALIDVKGAEEAWHLKVDSDEVAGPNLKQGCSSAKISFEMDKKFEGHQIGRAHV